MTTRREICTYAAFLVAGTCIGSGSRIALGKDGLIASLADDIRRLEAESGGRLGVAVLDTRTGGRAGHRANERFPMCSTFKFLAAAAVLKRVDAGQEALDRSIVFATGRHRREFAGDQGARWRGRHVARRTLRGGDDDQRQHGRQPAAGSARRTGRLHGICAIARRPDRRNSIVSSRS